MLLVLILSTTLCFILWLTLRWQIINEYWTKKGVPHLKRNPIFGSLTFLQRENPAVWFRRMYERFDVPYVGIWLFWRPALLVHSPEIAKNILVKDSALFRDRNLKSDISDPIGAYNLFLSKDPLWSYVRAHLSPVFTPAKLKHLYGLVAKKSNDLMRRIRNDTQQGKKIELRVLFSDYSTDVISTAAFGVETNATITGDGPFRAVTKDFQSYNTIRGLAWSSIFFLPELVSIFRFTFFPRHATDFFRKVFSTIVAQRGGYNRDISEPKDLLDFIVKMRQDSIKDNKELHEDVLVAQASVFLQAGFDTTAVTLAFCTYELAYNSKVQERLYEELLKEKQKVGDADIDGDTLSKCTYLNCVLKETLRRYPAMGWLDRVAAADYKVDDNLTISAGTPVYVNAIGMHMSDKYFPDPTKFDPDRFLPENEKNIKPFTYLPFGDGPRICIGLRLAYVNMRSCLSSLILNYEVRPLPNFPEPEDMRFETKGLFLIPGEDLCVEFVPRK